MSRNPIVSDFMERNCTRFKPKLKLSEALNVLIDRQLIAALVVDDQEQPIGILSEKDCLRELLNRGYNQMPLGTVKEYMHPAPEAISESMPIAELTKLFSGSPHRRWPVMEDGKLTGQITRRGVLMGYQKLLK
jgi:predicted transcriptional regulator